MSDETEEREAPRCDCCRKRSTELVRDEIGTCCPNCRQWAMEQLTEEMFF